MESRGDTAATDAGNDVVVDSIFAVEDVAKSDDRIVVVFGNAVVVAVVVENALNIIVVVFTSGVAGVIVSRIRDAFVDTMGKTDVVSVSGMVLEEVVDGIMGTSWP